MTLTLDKQVPYRRGEAITITVRFPDDSPPPPKTTQVRVKLHRKATKTNEQERRTIKLQHVEGSRGTYTGALTRTPEGRYRFWLDTPKVKGAVPETECLVLAPPGELELLRMNEDDMKQAARESRGRFYSLVDEHNVLKDLPAAERISISAPGPPFTVWNQWWMFVFVLLLMTTEWILRKLRHLL